MRCLVHHRIAYADNLNVIIHVTHKNYFILYIIKKFTQHVKRTLIKRKLSGLIFENNETKPKKLFQNQVEDLNSQVNNLVIESNKSNIGKDKTINLAFKKNAKNI